MNSFLDAVIGGWQLGSIFLWQSGPYMSPYFDGGDPSGTGSGIIGRDQAPDLAHSPNISNANRNDWFDLSAYTCPGTPNWQPGTNCLVGASPNSTQFGAPIGRFGNAGSALLVGPGTLNLNAGLAKYFSLTERVRIKVEGSFTNVLNHVNLANPVLAIDNPSVGQITSARDVDFGGARTGQVGARVEW